LEVHIIGRGALVDRRALTLLTRLCDCKIERAIVIVRCDAYPTVTCHYSYPLLVEAIDVNDEIAKLKLQIYEMHGLSAIPLVVSARRALVYLGRRM
jgi:hypothetical protein